MPRLYGPTLYDHFDKPKDEELNNTNEEIDKNDKLK